SRERASVSGSSAFRSASVSTGMIVKHGLCVDRTEVKIVRSTALVSKMIVSNIALLWPQSRQEASPSVGGLLSFRAALAFSINDSLLIGLDAGGGISHNGIYLRDAAPGERELGIANSKRALGGDKGSLILNTAGTLKRHV